MWLSLFSAPPSSFADLKDPHPLDFSGYNDLIKRAWETYVPWYDWRWWSAQIFQESNFDTKAVSGVGAKGLCQAMPATFGDWNKALRWTNADPTIARYCIEGGAFYMGQLISMSPWRTWDGLEPLFAAQGAYNAGGGNIRKAVVLAKAKSWAATAIALPQVTGKANARQTTDYVTRIGNWHRQLLNLPPWVTNPCAWSGHRGGCGPVRGIE